MYCTQCGIQLPDQAKFCFNCGAQQNGIAEKRFCRINFRQIDEKWSLFGKEIWRFEAVAFDGAVIETSEKITITGFELNGPNEKNRKHKAAFDALVERLLAGGWKKDSVGKNWYDVSFNHLDCQILQ